MTKHEILLLTYLPTLKSLLLRKIKNGHLYQESFSSKFKDGHYFLEKPHSFVHLKIQIPRTWFIYILSLLSLTGFLIGESILCSYNNFSLKSFKYPFIHLSPPPGPLGQCMPLSLKLPKKEVLKAICEYHENGTFK